jgi:integrase
MISNNKYNNPTLVNPSGKKPYVYFTDLQTRKKYRFYSGREVGMASPRGLIGKTRVSYFNSLLSVITSKLSSGWDPDAKEITIIRESKPLNQYSTVFKEYVDQAPFSLKYKYTLQWYFKELLLVFGKKKIEEITTPALLTHLLKRFSTSNTTYNTTRRYYKCIFNILNTMGYTTTNPVVGIKSKKSDASINEAYSKDELEALFDYLKLNERTLYRLGILMYTTFLRPHHEIRLLKVKYFEFDDKLLVIPPRYTKNGKQITIPLQNTVIEEFLYLKELDPDSYVFGSVNPDYFKTLWGRAVRKKYPHLKPNQTLYSIRHTAAVNIYKRSKDVALLQRLMNHSSMEVTLGYLRSLNCSLVGNNADMYPSL